MQGDRAVLEEAFTGGLAEFPDGHFMKGLSLDRCRGLFAAASGRAAEAGSYFERSLETCGRGDYRPELGQTCLDYARFRYEQGDIPHAVALVSRGLPVARQLGMPRLVRALTEVESMLAATTTDGLTGRECAVLRLVGAGKSNKEIGAELFISYHTVVNHLRHIYAKTGVSGRAQLVRYALTRTERHRPRH
jgi:DNA-binding CsgD family transcriptional regulator